MHQKFRTPLYVAAVGLLGLMGLWVLTAAGQLLEHGISG